MYGIPFNSKLCKKVGHICRPEIKTQSMFLELKNCRTCEGVSTGVYEIESIKSGRLSDKGSKPEDEKKETSTNHEGLFSFILRMMDFIVSYSPRDGQNTNRYLDPTLGWTLVSTKEFRMSIHLRHECAEGRRRRSQLKSGVDERYIRQKNLRN